LVRTDREELLKKDSYDWLCKCCEDIAKAKRKVVTAATQEGKDVSSPVSPFTRKSLRILQWNADGLIRKTDELAARLHESNIDICLVQETKLTKKNIDPAIRGYKPYRYDRENVKFGGLIAYVKQDIDFQKIGKRTKKATAVLSLRVRTDKSTWINLSNVYTPLQRVLVRKLTSARRLSLHLKIRLYVAF
jgi:exonuclease III